MRGDLPKRERVPAYHDASPESQALLEVMTDASLEDAAAFEDLTAQFFLSTATWGLAFWEEQVGLPTDETLTLAARRDAVRQKLLASGNTTAEMVRELAESITGYEARVVVNDDYSFSLEFLGQRNELADINVEEIRTIVEQIKPAHLRFVISGLTWKDVESLPLVWRYFDDDPTTWADFESKFCVHKK